MPVIKLPIDGLSGRLIGDAENREKSVKFGKEN